MSGSETLPALEATCLEGGATGSSLHAMTEAVTALPTSNFWLVRPFHGNNRRRVEEDRLRSVAKLCQSVEAERKTSATRAKVPRSAKNSDGSRKELMCHPSSLVVENGMAIFGKTFHYLGFSCGKMWRESCTPLILAFLTIP